MNRMAYKISNLLRPLGMIFQPFQKSISGQALPEGPAGGIQVGAFRKRYKTGLGGIEGFHADGKFPGAFKRHHSIFSAVDDQRWNIQGLVHIPIGIGLLEHGLISWAGKVAQGHGVRHFFQL